MSDEASVEEEDFVPVERGVEEICSKEDDLRVMTKSHHGLYSVLVCAISTGSSLLFTALLLISVPMEK
jgi:hypothetical protein